MKYFFIFLFCFFLVGCVNVERYDYVFDVDFDEWYIDFDMQFKDDEKFIFNNVDPFIYKNNNEVSVGVIDIDFLETYKSGNYIDIGGYIGNSGHGDLVVSLIGKCYIYGLKDMSENELINGLEFMKDRGVKYVNFSAGRYQPTLKVRDWLIDNKDITLVASAGNDKKLMYPGGLLQCIGVGAYDESGEIYSWSARDDVYRLGKNGNNYGTSYSSPRYCLYAYDEDIKVDDLLLNNWIVVIDYKEGREWFYNVSVGDILLSDVYVYKVYCLLDRDMSGDYSKGDLYGEVEGNKKILVSYVE